MALYVTAGIILFLSGGYFIFEKSRMGTKDIALMATLSAFAAISRLPFAAIPNVQPTTFLVALSGYMFGPYQGFLVGCTAALVSNIFLGQGPWTPWQMLAWGVVGAISGVLGLKGKGISVLVFSLLCFAFGFLFDWIMNLWFIIGYIRPLSFRAVLVAYLTGLTVDFMHAGGNFVFSMLFFDKFRKVLGRFKRRLQVSKISKISKNT